MAYSAKLSVDGNEFKVRHCNYSLHQNIDETGRPMSGVLGGTIQLEIESSDNTFFMEWMVDPIKKLNGSIAFSKTNEEGELKKVEFEDGFLTGYSESMDALSNAPMVENIVISARTLSVGGASLENIWE